MGKRDARMIALESMLRRLRIGGSLTRAETTQVLALTASAMSDDVARQLAGVIGESRDEQFIPLLVRNVTRDPGCALPQTSSFLFALGECLEESDDAFARPREYFPPAFIQVLGHWLLCTGGGELSWKASFVLHNIRVDESFHFLRIGVLDASLLPQARANCLLGLVNGRAPGLQATLDALAEDADRSVRSAAQNAKAWLRRGR